MGACQGVVVSLLFRPGTQRAKKDDLLNGRGNSQVPGKAEFRGFIGSGGSGWLMCICKIGER